MGQNSEFIHAWLSCTSEHDDCGFDEPPRGESPVLGYEDASLPVQPTLTSQSSRSSLRPRSNRISGQCSRNAVYLSGGTDNEFDRLTQLLAALPPSPTSRMYACQESANSSQVWIGSTTAATPLHTPVSPTTFPSSHMIRKAKSHATFGSSSTTTTSSSLHSPASSFSLATSSPVTEENGHYPSPQIVAAEDTHEPKSRWSLSSSNLSIQVSAPPPLPSKKEKRVSNLNLVVFPRAPEPVPPLVPPKDLDSELPYLDTERENNSTVSRLTEDQHKQKKRKRERFYSFITSSSKASSGTSYPPTPTPSTPTPTPTPSFSPSEYPSPYSRLPASLSTAYLSSTDDEGGEDDPFSGSRFAQSSIPLPPMPDSSTVSSIGSIGSLAVDPYPVTAPTLGPVPPERKRSSLGLSLSKHASSGTGALKQTPSLPLLHSSLPSSEDHSKTLLDPPHDKKKARSSIGLRLGMGARKRHLSTTEQNSPVPPSPSPSAHSRLSMISTRGKKRRIELTISYRCETEDAEDTWDDKETLLRAWCETLGHIRSIQARQSGIGSGELIIIYKKLEGGASVASTLQSKQVNIRGVGSVSLSCKTL